MNPKPNARGRAGAEGLRNASKPTYSEKSPVPSSASKGGQENIKEKDFICAIHKQVGCDGSTGGTNISLLKAISKEIEKSINKLLEKSGNNTESSSNPTISAHSNTFDLRKAVDSTMTANKHLLTYRRELKAIGDQVKSIADLHGFQIDIKSDKETPGAEVKQILKQLEQANRELSEDLKLLTKTIGNEHQNKGVASNLKSGDKKKITKPREMKKGEATNIRDESHSTVIKRATKKFKELEGNKREFSHQLKLLDQEIMAFKTGIEQEQGKIAQSKSKPDIKTKPQRDPMNEELTNMADDSESAIIERAIKRVKEFQEYTSKVDSLAGRILLLSNQQRNQKQYTVSLSQLEQAVNDVSDIVKRNQKPSEKEQLLDAQIKQLSMQLKSLDQVMDSSDVGADQQINKTDKLSKVKGNEIKESKKEATNKPNDFESDLLIITNAASRLKSLDENNKRLRYIILEVSYFVKASGEFTTENINSRTPSPASNKQKKKIKNSKDQETSTGKEDKNTNPENLDDASIKEFQKHWDFLKEAHNRMKYEISNLKMTLSHVSSAVIHIKKVTDKEVDPKAKFELQNSTSSDSEEMFRCNQSLIYLVNRTLNSIEEVQKVNRELELAKKENDSLQQRLSKIAGSKLTEGNPDITNLGDPNRPMKIGEWYSELYDNEWTDAIDLCHTTFGKKYDEDATLQALYKTLMTCYLICKEKSSKSLMQARAYFQDASKEVMIDTQEEEMIKLVIEKRKLAADLASKQLLKAIQEGSFPDAKKFLKDIDEKLLKIIQPSKFFSQCLTLCWKMVAQDPPLVLLEGPPKGKEFDRNKFREYTSSGTKVVFTVWPALYLHENGPLLVKGVVKVK